MDNRYKYDFNYFKRKEELRKRNIRFLLYFLFIVYVVIVMTFSHIVTVR